MPVPTPELGLAQAVDADDTADYLVTGLANSLVTVDALFNNVAGHTHGGVHQGGPISSIPASAIPLGSITSGMIADGTIQSADIAPGAITSANLSPPIDIGGVFRTHGQVGEGTGTGPGMELFYNGTGNFIQGFDYGTSLYLPIEIIANKITLSIQGGTNFVLDASGNVTLSGTLTTAGTITIGSGAYLFLADATHFITASGTSVAYACPAGGQHVFEFNAGGSAPINCGAITTTTISCSGITATSLTINGPLNGAAAVFSGVVTAAEFNLGAPTQYLLPVNTSIRYAVGPAGNHSFEFAAGGPASISCMNLTAAGDISAGGSLTFNGAFQGGAVEAIGGTHKSDWQVVVNGTVYRIQLWQ